MRSSSGLVTMFACLWGGCLDTAADTPGPTGGSAAASGSWAAGAGSDKPELAQPSTLRAVSAHAGGGGARAVVKTLQPSAAGGGARSEAGHSAPVVRAARDAGVGGAEGQPALAPEPSALPVPEREGDLIITEIMADPKALSDTQGEWIELYNATESTLELRECQLADGEKSMHDLTPRLLVEPGAYFTIARIAEPGFTPDLIVPLSLTNSADSVAILCHGIEIDRVSYDESAAFAVKAGASLALDPEQLDVRHNDEGSAWCPGQEAYATDLGSPGRANPSCHTDSEWETEKPADPGDAGAHDAGAEVSRDAGTMESQDAGIPSSDAATPADPDAATPASY